MERIEWSKTMGRKLTSEQQRDADDDRDARRHVHNAFAEMTGSPPNQVKRSLDCGAWIYIASHLRPWSDPSYPPTVTLCKVGAVWHAMAMISDDGRPPSYAESRDMRIACDRAVALAKAARAPKRKQWQGVEDNSRAAWVMERNGDAKKVRERSRIASGVIV